MGAQKYFIIDDCYGCGKVNYENGTLGSVTKQKSVQAGPSFRNSGLEEFKKILKG